MGLAQRLPRFPWDRLHPVGELARSHPAGAVDLSVGTPVDPTPPLVQAALCQAADAPGYPQTHGSAVLREAVSGWFARRLDVPDVDPAAVLPTIGSKEFIAWLPTLLGLGAGDLVVHPALAYPTYELGARLAGCEVVAADATVALGPRRPALVWLNSPANPHGKVLPADHMAKVVSWARERGAIVVSDECYVEYGWDAKPVSVLHRDVCGGSFDGLLAVHSLSKRSNLAGYRAGFIAGDPRLVDELLQVRRHAGMMVAAPVQAAMVAALGDDAHVVEQRRRYAARRDLLRAALGGAGFRIDDSEGSIYLWATRDEPCWDSLAWLAGRGILAAPGEFYGLPGAKHVRLAFTASDQQIDTAAERLAG